MHVSPCRARLLPLALSALLLGAPLAHAADASCRYTPLATLSLLDSGNHPRPLVDGSVNGQPARFYVNTGSSATRLSKAMADKLHLPLRQLPAHTNGIGGASTMYAVKVDDFAVGDIHSGKTSMTVLGNQPGNPQDGSLGADFLMQADVEFSMAEKTLRFFRPTNCKDTYLAYWGAGAVELPFGGTYTRHANPRFMIEVNGVKLEAYIGTGTMFSSITRNAAGRAGIKLDGEGARPTGSVTGIGDETISTWQVEANSLSFGSETIQHAHLTVLDTPPQGSQSGFPDVILGMDFLKTHRVLIANDQRRFYISYLGGEVFPGRPVRRNN